MDRSHNRVRRNYAFAEKKLVLEAFCSDAYDGVSLKDFSGVCGINYYTLRDWLRSIDWDISRIDELNRTPGRKRSPENLLSLDLPVQRLILEVKQRQPDWGPLKIKQYLFRHEQLLIPTTRIYKFLKSKGLVKEQSERTKESHDRSFEYPHPLAAVQMDLMHVTLSNGSTIYLVTMIDDFSRFVIGQRFIPVKTMDEVRLAFLESVRIYGVMERLLTDHGSEFVSWQSFTQFEELLSSLDVEHIASGPDRKENQGKAERWHQTVRSKLRRRGPLDYSSEAQLWIREVVNEYNYERPHQGIGGLVPADRFFGLKEELEAELESYQAQERKGQRIYFACRVGEQKLVVSGPRADHLSVLLNGKSINDSSPCQTDLASVGGNAILESADCTQEPQHPGNVGETINERESVDGNQS